MYGNYNFWSWFRYWYVDSVNYVTMLLLDKGYFDYDYEKVSAPAPVVDWESTIRTEEELHEMLAGFGFGVKKKKKPETLEEIQEHVIKNM